jgi:hypothetical protein
MRRERLAPDDVTSIVTRPDLTTRDSLGHTVAWRRGSRFWMGVVYANQHGDVTVITVIPSKRPKGV